MNVTSFAASSWHISALAAALVLVAALGGCGDDATSTTTVLPTTAGTTTTAESTTTTLPTAGTPVVIDTDLALDSVMAVLYLLGRPELEVRAITVSGTGEVHCDPGVEIAAGLVALAGHRGMPGGLRARAATGGGQCLPDVLEAGRRRRLGNGAA